jgi:glycine dehydrogenase subunit 2
VSHRIRLVSNGETHTIEPTNGEMPSIFDKSVPGRTGFSLPAEKPDTTAAVATAIPSGQLRTEAPGLPEVSELDVQRHFTQLSSRTLGVDTTFYPLGSCTMKYNPKINEAIAGLSGFTQVHPAQPSATMQGFLEAHAGVQEFLGALTGLPGVSLQPPAGAQGEYTALLVAKAYFRARGETQRLKVIFPDTAHGTNPASASRVGWETCEIKSNSRGRIDLASLRAAVGPDTACLMVTNPNTLGLFEDEIGEAARIVHEAGGLVYIDGANFNAVVGRVRPGDFGGDMMHINMHKTFSVPHGGGGPGLGPICVRDFLAPYLPAPHVVRLADGSYTLQHDCPKSIGKVRSFFANMNHVIRSYTYLRQLGQQGCKDIASYAVLHANYLLSQLAGAYDIPYGHRCMHEFVIDGTRQKKQGVRAVDIAKRLIDFGFHPPTTYFPLIVPEALMIEPTETENREMLDLFAATMLHIADQIARGSTEFADAPTSTPVTRMDELSANRQPVTTYQNTPPAHPVPTT